MHVSAVLTNGVEYQFYTDLESPNRMDSKPFMVLDLGDLDESLLPELRKLTKASFDLESVIDAAEKLKYIGAIKRTLAEQFQEPEDEWVKFFAGRVYDGAFTKRAREQFTPLVQEAATAFLEDQVNGRLKKALETTRPQTEDLEAVSGEEAAEESLKRDDGIETTLEELEGYQVVKAIACSEVKPQRIAHRDSKSYFAILLDDNNRKPIARLRFNAKTRKYRHLRRRQERDLPSVGLRSTDLPPTPKKSEKRYETTWTDARAAWSPCRFPRPSPGPLPLARA